MNNDIDNIFVKEDDSCDWAGFICSLFFIFWFIFYICFFGYTYASDKTVIDNLESLCNEYHDINSCSFVYKNDDVVLFDTYNGYVTMENILK